VGSLQEKRLLKIAEGVEKRYAQFAAALKDLKNSRPTQIVYVAGNHDFMLQLSPELRRRIAGWLSLEHNGIDEFPIEWSDETLGVYADHGHRHDSINWHKRETGLWAFGDAVVLLMVNKFGALARSELHLTDETVLGRAVHEIDNVEPHFHIPLYIAWLARRNLVSGTDREKLRECWHTAVNDLLKVQLFQESRYGKLASAIRWLRSLYELDVFDPNILDRLMNHMAKIPSNIINNYPRAAHLLHTEMPLRIFGHTHEPGVFGLPESGGIPGLCL
jgi:hypothetical protein